DLDGDVVLAAAEGDVHAADDFVWPADPVAQDLGGLAGGGEDGGVVSGEPVGVFPVGDVDAAVDAVVSDDQVDRGVVADVGHGEVEKRRGGGEAPQGYGSGHGAGHGVAYAFLLGRVSKVPDPHAVDGTRFDTCGQPFLLWRIGPGSGPWRADRGLSGRVGRVCVLVRPGSSNR